ncbi:hypothetical protein WS70_17680 [Burkholderia mayonis]|uniref:Uncharacterized protein n=1 Tax=Burkholderia mayonis TaxID=1385591 RepID=A0A1B4FJH7_9BURK|nr:hypothetical protein [Burkholderia mayonis]AOJ03762.1 hypothetical protein WS70_17680 [Burkholderia mayonis]KVE44249.1 hypothetical protein WS70_00365 [Burkholderia mayonis]
MTASVEAVGGLRLDFLANGILPNDAVRQAFVQHSTEFGGIRRVLDCVDVPVVARGIERAT